MIEPSHAPEEAEWYELRTRYRFGAMTVRLTERIMGHGVVEWWDRCAVVPRAHAGRGGEAQLYEGMERALPDDPVAKHGALEEAHAWLERARGVNMGVVQLWRGDRALLFDEGFFGLALTPGEYAALQDHWAAFGLPRDLCYRRGPDVDSNTADQLDYGDAPEDLARKRRAFARECGRFLIALSARHSALPSEWPGDAEERREVEALDVPVGHAMLRAIRLVGDWRGAPPGDPWPDGPVGR